MFKNKIYDIKISLDGIISRLDTTEKTCQWNWGHGPINYLNQSTEE